MKLTWLGHACFLLETAGSRLLIDPYLRGNALAACPPEAVEADWIFVTHGHGDHLGDAVEIAWRTGAPVCCTADLAAAVFAPAGVNTLEGNLGGWLSLPFGRVKFTAAVHGSGVPGGLACGFLFDAEEKRIYHAGDTALTTEFRLLEPEKLDAALLPIGDVYTMGPEDALRAIEMLRPRVAVPMHYNTFPQIRQDPAAFAAAAKQRGFAVRVLESGGSMEL